MKKAIILLTALLILACSFAFLVSAEDKIVTSVSNEYGELTVFDEAIGNTGISNLKDDGTVARAVLFDGTNYYTVPTTYILTESPKNSGGKTGEMLLLSFNEINTKLGKSFNKNSIIRFEFPSDIAFICNGNETLNNCNNVVEIIVNDGLRIWDNSDQRKVFTNCKKLESIDISGMIIEYPKSAFAMFEYCESLEYIKLPDAYFDGTSYVNYDTNHMFSGCKKLETIENLGGFFKGVTSLGYKTFYNCYVLENVTLWDGLQTIEGRAFGNCNAFTEVIIPDSVTTIGTNSSGGLTGTVETVFESCKSLKKVVLPKKVALGTYCFEKCTALTDIWMPTEESTFANQAFGQIGSSNNINFYFQTANNTVTYTGTDNKNDPYVTAIRAEGDARLRFETPLSVKCTVFLGGHDVSGEGVYGFSGQSYVTDYVKTTLCTRGCGEKTTETVANALFTNKGYSKEMDGSFFTYGIVFNKAEIAKYVSLQAEGYVFNYGIVLANAELSEDGTLFDENAQAIDGAYALDVTNVSYTVYNIKITGIDNAQKDTPVYVSAYAIDNGVASYIGEEVTESAVAITYNTVKKKD